MPYHGKDHNDYVNGAGFCCEGKDKKLQAYGGGIGKGNEEYEKMQYYYHADHLGSSSYITNLDAQIVQHVEYVPFGEVFIEERNQSWNTPYLFNGKELDEETGLYYYGARYYNPRESVWLSVDPMAEVFPGRNPYEYTFNNPVKYTDPTGMAPDHEYEVTHDQNGKEVKKKISDLGGDQVDFEHHLDGKHKGDTEVKIGGNSSVWVKSDAIRGYTSRGINVSPWDIYKEWNTGTGPEKSLFLESDINFSNCGATGSCLKKQPSIFSISDWNSEIGYQMRSEMLKGNSNVWIDWGVWDVLTTPDSWSQMIGSSWGTMKKFSNSSLIMYMVQDSKSKNSFYLHYGKENNISRSPNKITPQGNTYQTYIWFEWRATSERKVNQYNRKPFLFFKNNK